MKYPDGEPMYLGDSYDPKYAPPVKRWRFFCERGQQFALGIAFVYHEAPHIDFAFGPFVIGFERADETGA